MGQFAIEAFNSRVLPLKPRSLKIDAQESKSIFRAYGSRSIFKKIWSK